MRIRLLDGDASEMAELMLVSGEVLRNFQMQQGECSAVVAVNGRAVVGGYIKSIEFIDCGVEIEVARRPPSAGLPVAEPEPPTDGTTETTS